jgi:hypothetical protein
VGCAGPPPKPGGRELLALTMIRLDNLLETTWPLLDSDDPDVVLGAVDRIIAIMDRHCRLAGIEQLGLERGHRTLVVHRKGGKTVTITIPLAPRTARALDLAIALPARVPDISTAERDKAPEHELRGLVASGRLLW